MSDTQNTPADPATTISPKVTASTLVAFAAPVAVAALDAITIDLLAGLGAWAPVALAAISALSAGIAGYVTRDPLRRQLEPRG